MGRRNQGKKKRIKILLASMNNKSIYKKAYLKREKIKINFKIPYIKIKAFNTICASSVILAQMELRPFSINKMLI